MSKLAKRLYEEMAQFPIISPHGHVDSNLLAENTNWSDAVELLIRPDHYVTRMLYSQGIIAMRVSVEAIALCKALAVASTILAGKGPEGI